MAYFGSLGFPLLVFFDGFPSYRLKLIASLGVHKWIMGASVCAHKCSLYCNVQLMFTFPAIAKVDPLPWLLG